MPFPFRRGREPLATPRRVLVIALKFLGDLLVATPVLRALRATWPAAHVGVMFRRGYEEALEGNAAVDDLLPLPVPLRGARLWRAMRTARRMRPDLVLALEPGDKEAMIAFGSGAPVRVAPDFQSMARLFTHRVPVREDAMDYREYYLAIAAAAGATTRDRTTTLAVRETARAWADAVLVRHDMTGRRILAVHPGARAPERRWPPERFAQVIDALVPGACDAALLIGGANETPLVDAVAAACRNRERVTTVPACTIQQTAALMARSALCLTNDSAPRHIAAAVGTPSVATQPFAHRHTWAIYEPRMHPVVLGPATAPHTVGAIDVAAVIEAVQAVLGGSTALPPPA